MKKKVLQNYQQLASHLSLRLDEPSGLIYGAYGGYDVLIYMDTPGNPYTLTAAVSAKRLDGLLEKAAVKEFVKSHKKIKILDQQGYLVKVSTADLGTGEGLAEGMREVLDAFLNFLRTNGFSGCCQTCGRAEPVKACVAGEAYMNLCDSCYTNLQQNQAIQSSGKKRKKENIAGGIVGALIGSLLGVACIILLSQLGYVAAVSGLVMAVCTLKGYEILGGKLSTPGIIVCAVVMVVMIYVGNQLDWAVAIVQQFDSEVGIGEAFRFVPELLREDKGIAAQYWGGLAMVYIFAIGGGVPTMRSAVQNQRRNDSVYRPGV